MNDKISVDIVESEKGWGQKIDEVKKFDTMDLALGFIKEFNKENNQKTVPDWYMYARLSN